MKRLIPIILITVFGMLSFVSCKKKSSSSTCTCKEKGLSGQDTTVTFSAVDTPFTSLSTECTAFSSLMTMSYGSGYTCHL